MTTRWLGFWIVLLVVGGSRLASAQVTLNPAGTVTTTSTLVGTTSAPGTTTVSAASNPDVDFVVTSTCAVTTGAGTFAVSPPTAKLSQLINVTYTPSARGARQCTVSVRNAAIPFGTGTEIGTLEVSGTGVAPVIGVTPTTSPYDFLSVRVLDPAVKTQVFTITNNGDSGQTLTITNISFSGTNAADFSVTVAPTSTSLAQGASTTFTVQFNPSASGARVANMDIVTNDPITSTKTIGVKGSGTLAVIAVSDVTFMPNTLAGTTASATSTVSNQEPSFVASLPLKTATVVGNNGSTWFSFGAGLGCTAGQAACTFTAGTTAPANIPVQCAPPATASGTETATLTIVSDTDATTSDGKTADSTATLTCTAVRPNVSIDKPSPISIDFGSTNVNSSATPQTITVSNTGSSTLTFYFTKPGADIDSPMFSLSTSTGCGTSSANKCSIAAGAAAIPITVGFTPTSMGAKQIIAVLTTNDPDAGDGAIDLQLDGNGIAPVIATLPNPPTPLAFGSVEIGKTSSEMAITVTNSGTANLTINSAAVVVAPGSTQFAITQAAPSMLAPSASADIKLKCTPTAQGTQTHTFRINSNSGFGASSVNTDITMTCTGTRGFLTITPASWDFMGVREGDMVTHDFTLTNTGNLPVSNISYVADAKLLGFTITAYPTSLAAGASGTVTVKFYPVNDTYGCAVVNSGDCVFTFSGDWGVTPTKTMVGLLTKGDGLKATYDTYPASPNALDLGTIRWDATSTMAVNVINTGGAPINIKGLSITPGTALAGELAVTSCTHNSVVVPCPTMAAPFASSGVNDTLVVNVTCDPQDRVAMIDGTLTVSSDLNTSTPNRSVPLKCNSNTAILAIDPANNVLDFGATDLDAVPVAVTKTIRMKNTGAAPLNIDAATKGGAALARFTFSVTTAQVVAPGGEFDVDVTYLPLAEKPPNTPDTASITFPVRGHLGGMNSVTVQISGYGADRHIGVSPAPTFPDTFKNPGDAAPVMAVTITNTGYAPLDVSAVMLDNSPIWTLDNPDPVVIPAASSHDFLVRFQPLMAGKAPTGHLVIMDNDNEVGKALVQVDLDGNGLNRAVAMGPRVIPLGFTGIGIPIRLSELAPDAPLIVENADMVNGFNIVRIEVDDISGAAGTFKIIDDRGNEPSDVALPPGGSRTFDITFTPTEVGDFEATASLYLDQDPMPQAQVTLKGRGLYVDARGGGGCSTGRSSSGGLLALVLGALVTRRRRKRAAVVGVGIVGTLVATTAPSAAQASRNLDLNVFDPTPATVSTTFHSQSASIASDGSWAASALLTYANNALVLDTTQNDDAAVKNRTMMIVGGAYAFGGRFEGSVRLPLLVQSGDPAGDPEMRFGVAPASGAALGDATLQVKAFIGERGVAGGTLSYGAALAFTVPTGTGGEFAGNDLPTVHGLGLASFVRERISASINIGGVAREHVTFANITQGPGMSWAVGASVRALDQLWISGDLFGDLVPGGKRSMSGQEELLDTIEGLAGVRYRLARTMDLGAAIGRGVTTGPGTPAVRALVTFAFTPGAEELTPLHRYRPDGPPKDDDHDGIRNTVDDCPDEAEDMDGFQDDDGCPDGDNDGDGIPDAADKCPAQAEDKDRFQDDDGCPDGDNDGDGVLDAKDKCPLASEDKDGFQDDDGCPEPDNDKDGLLDALDKCPTEAEIINGNADDDGCPDKGDALVVLSPDRMETLESIVFSGSRISRSSQNVLGQIGATLRAHPEILRVRIGAHVQPTRNAEADQKLSEARAKAVREWLVDFGIDELRLQSSGFGGGKPLVPATTKGAQQINDRIELIILERK